MAVLADFRQTIVLTGPTGSGKSALALAFAEEVGGEIVAMDSMTLYRGMDIGTAKPTAEERARVPHHLIDILDPWEFATVAWWLERAVAAVRDIEARGKRAIIVGGTPLYLKALLFGLFEGPPRDPTLRGQLEAEDATVLHRRLATVDPTSAQRLHPNDVRRVVRALEVWELTGRPISDWQTSWKSPPSDPFPQSRDEKGDGARPLVVCLDLPRTELYSRIDRRVLTMMDAGWLDETRRLQALPRPLSREAAAALGYRELLTCLDGSSDLCTVVRLIQQRTRNYAKRQLTWFRHMPSCEFATAELTSDLLRSRMK
ncbi:MAG: tRNA (adenosine(37)-N6)-dimethylallyltransferase MiaA [Gemmataceae bacterium]